jgi:hypothetical protein
MPRLATLPAVVAPVFLSMSVRAETLQWAQQLGTSDWDQGHSASADGLGNVYISGRTDGSLEGTNAGGSDAFISKGDESGTLLWTQLLGTSEDDAGIRRARWILKSLSVTAASCG